MFGGLGSIRKRLEYFALTCGSRSPVGSSVMKSSLLSMTSWVIFVTRRLRDGHRVDVALRDAGDVEAGRLRERVLARRVLDVDRVRADARDASCVGLERRLRGRRRRGVGEGDREEELAVGLGQLDDDLAGRVVGRDAADVGVFLLGLDVLGDAVDRRGERRERAAEEVQALDRVLEVRGLDGGAVGVLQALAQLEGVGLIVGGDRRHRLGEAGDEVGAGGAGLVLVGHEARVDELQRLVGLHRLEHHRVVVVRQDAADLDRAARLLGRVVVA